MQENRRTSPTGRAGKKKERPRKQIHFVGAPEFEEAGILPDVTLYLMESNADDKTMTISVFPTIINMAEVFVGLSCSIGHGLADTGAQLGMCGFTAWRDWVCAMHMSHPFLVTPTK